MSTRIAVGIREIGRVISGEQTLLVRVAGTMRAKFFPGAQLWLAEPFHLEHSFDGLSPTAARDRGAKPAFAADYTYDPKGLAKTHGVRHPARSLCKDWHRAHLVIIDRTEIRLQDLAPEDFTNLGFRSPKAFAEYWDVEASLAGTSRFRWRNNPLVLRMSFALVMRPLKFAAKPEPKKRGPRVLTQKSTPPPPAERPVAVNAPIVAPMPRPVAPPPPKPAPQGMPAAAAPESRCTGPQTPVDRIFSTGKGDKAFLEALKRERPAMHRAPAALTSEPRAPQPQRLSAPEVASDNCRVCGARRANGCEHYPLTQQREAAV